MLFSNGAEGRAFEARNCDHCPLSNNGCSVLLQSMNHNDQQVKNKDLRECLDVLIDKNGCSVFFDLIKAGLVESPFTPFLESYDKEQNNDNR